MNTHTQYLHQTSFPVCNHPQSLLFPISDEPYSTSCRDECCGSCSWTPSWWIAVFNTHHITSWNILPHTNPGWTMIRLLNPSMKRIQGWCCKPPWGLRTLTPWLVMVEVPPVRGHTLLQMGCLGLVFPCQTLFLCKPEKNVSHLSWSVNKSLSHFPSEMGAGGREEDLGTSETRLGTSKTRLGTSETRLKTSEMHLMAFQMGLRVWWYDKYHPFW